MSERGKFLADICRLCEKQNVKLSSVCLAFEKNGIIADFAWDSDVERVKVSADDSSSTKLAEVTLYALKPGDEIWLNGLFHAGSSDSGAAVLSVKILKNNIIIYHQVSDVSTGAQNVSVQTVDMQRTAGSAAYTLAVSAENAAADVFGHRTLTAAVIRR